MPSLLDKCQVEVHIGEVFWHKMYMQLGKETGLLSRNTIVTAAQDKEKDGPERIEIVAIVDVEVMEGALIDTVGVKDETVFIEMRELPQNLMIDIIEAVVVQDDRDREVGAHRLAHSPPDLISRLKSLQMTIVDMVVTAPPLFKKLHRAARLVVITLKRDRIPILPNQVS